MKRGTKFRLLFVASSIFAGTHFLLLGSVTAAIIVFINGLRWLVSIFSKKKIFVFLFIIGILTVGYFTYESWISVITIIAGILGVLAAFNPNQIVTRKILFIVAVLWIIYNSIIFTPVGIISEAFFLVSNVIGYYRNDKKSKIIKS
jgi:hypothetical protein